MKKSSLNTNKELASHFESKLHSHERFLIKHIFGNSTISLSSTFNEDELIKYAIKNGVAPLLYTNEVSNSLSDYNKNKLKNSYFHTLLNNTQHFETIKWIQKILTKHSIKFIFLKGSLLAFTRYKDASLRPMSDIDFLIENGKATIAYDILMHNGASGKKLPFKIAQNDHHLPPIRYENSLIEVHRTLLPLNSKFNINNTALFEHSTLWQKQNIKIQGSSAKLTAIHVALHLYYTFLRGGLRLSWFYDLHILTNDLKQVKDNELNSFAQQHQLTQVLSFVGSIYNLLSGQQLPNWPNDEGYGLKKIDIDRVIKSFRAGNKQDTRESYQVIIEQIKEAKGLKNKMAIIHMRLSKNQSLKGFSLFQHTMLTAIRFMAYLANTILKKLKIK